MFQIIEVELQTAEHLLHRVGIAVVERGVGRQARTDLVQFLVAGIAFHYLVDEILALRTGADERHVALQHVPELGQLVEMVSAQEASEGCQTVVISFGQLRNAVLLIVYNHGAELVDVERATALADALLNEDGRTFGAELQANVYDEIYWRKDNESQYGANDVKQSFCHDSDFLW